MSEPAFQVWMAAEGIRNYDKDLPRIFCHMSKRLAQRLTKNTRGTRTLRGGDPVNTGSYYGGVEPSGAYSSMYENVTSQFQTMAGSHPGLAQHMMDGGSSKLMKARVFVKDCLKEMKMSERAKSAVVVSVAEKLSEIVAKAKRGKKSGKNGISLRITDFFEKMIV